MNWGLITDQVRSGWRRGASVSMAVAIVLVGMLFWTGHVQRATGPDPLWSNALFCAYLTVAMVYLDGLWGGTDLGEP